MKADGPDNERRDRAGDKADDEYLEGDRTGQLREEARPGVDADDGDENDEAEIFEHVACRVRCVAEEAQPRDGRRHNHIPAMGYVAPSDIPYRRHQATSTEDPYLKNDQMKSAQKAVCLGLVPELRHEIIGHTEEERSHHRDEDPDYPRHEHPCSRPADVHRRQTTEEPGWSRDAERRVQDGKSEDERKKPVARDGAHHVRGEGAVGGKRRTLNVER